MDLNQFDPTVAELNALVAKSSTIVKIDLNDKAQLTMVKENRIALRDARIAIEKKGKELRDDANKFAKAVISKEKELIAIVEPEEDRLKLIEEEAKKTKEREDRLEFLPQRKEQLAKIDDGIVIDDFELLEMDSDKFQGYLNKRISDKNEKVRLDLERREGEVKRAEDQKKRDAEIAEREEQARKDERERQERLQKQKEEQAEKDRKAEEDRKAREEQERLDKIQREKEKLEKEKGYQDFLASCGWTEEKQSEFWIQRDLDTGMVRVYKLVGELKIN